VTGVQTCALPICAGYWCDASNWSYGTVPTASEAVEIDNGTVKVTPSYAAFANRVQVMPGGTLIVSNNASLEVDATGSPIIHGMVIGGNLEVIGKLVVKNVGNGDGISVSGAGVFEVTEYGNVNIRNTASSGIWNNASVINRGYLLTEDNNNFGILNYGSINNDDGKLIILGDGSSGILCYLNGQLTNSGYLLIKGGGIVLQNHSNVMNEEDGFINIAYPDSYAIRINANNNIFENYGKVYASYAIELYGIYNEDTFINYEGGVVVVDDAYNCISNTEGAYFRNEGNITLGEEVSNSNIWNKGEFYNYVCGDVQTNHKVYNYAPGVIDNAGNWYNNSALNSLNFAQFINDGLIEDTPNTFPSSIINNEVISKPITGTVQVGVPVSNALDVGNITKHTVNGWYTTESLTQTAGPYNEALNEWTPHTGTAGLTEVFVSLTSNHENCSSVLRVPVPGGVAPFTTPEAFSGINAGDEIGKFTVYPNPFEETLHLKVPEGINGVGSIQLYNTLGKMVYHKQAQLEAGMIMPIATSDYLPGGTYMLKVSSGQSVSWSSKLVKLP